MALGDVGTVLDFIAENWSKAADDFAIERKWGRLSIEDERRSEALIALEDQAHSKEFDALVGGVAQGTLVLDFFGSLSTEATATVEFPGTSCERLEINRADLTTALAPSSTEWLRMSPKS